MNCHAIPIKILVMGTADSENREWTVEVNDGVRWKEWEKGSLEDVLTEYFTHAENFVQIRLTAPLNTEAITSPCSTCSATGDPHTHGTILSLAGAQ